MNTTISKSPAGTVYVIALLTSDDVAIAILVAVLVLLGRFPGRRLSLCQGLNIYMCTCKHTDRHACENDFILRYKHTEKCTHIWA